MRWNTSLIHLLADEGALDAPCWRPNADIFRTGEGAWLIKLDLAGVRPEDVRVEIEGSTLRIFGTRKDSKVGEGWEPFLMEIAYSRFERTFQLPLGGAEADVTASHRDGMLFVSISTAGDRPKEKPGKKETSR